LLDVAEMWYVGYIVEPWMLRNC